MSDTKRRTLEEIEALAAEATPGPWMLNADPPYDSVVGSDGRTVCCDTAYYPTAVSIEDMRLITEVWTLLAIAQGQREELARRPRVGSCVWTLPDLTDRSFWSSTCGHEWQFLDGSPSENDAKFCPFCGGEIEEDAGKQE